MDNESPLETAIRIAGGTAGLAKRINESVQTVNNWRARGVPASRCAAIERATGVDRRTLRPDDWKDYWPELARRRVRA
jgi:DNA-binding transcriptional regulator YdaS (Cro superfamily)